MRIPAPEARVSVIIPNRNTLDTLPAALRSVRLQHFPGIEIIVIDDGSTDGSREWLAEMAREAPDLRVFHSESIGPAGARNLGISMASAPIIAFLDSDDVWERGKLRVQVEFMERNSEVGMTFTDYRHVGPAGEDRGTCFEYWQSAFRRQPPSHFFPVENAEALILGCNLVGTSTVAVRKSLLQNANGFATGLISAEDWDLWLRLAAKAPVAATSMVSTMYLMRPGSLTARSRDRISAMRDIAARYDGWGTREVRAALGRVQARLFRAEAEINRADAAFAAAAQAEFRAFLAEPDRRKVKAMVADLFRCFRLPRYSAPRRA